MTPSFARRSAYGLLIGAIISGFEVGGLPLAGLPLADQASAAIPMVLVWSASAMAACHAAYWLEPRVRPRTYALAMAAVLVVLSVVTEWTIWRIANLGFGMQAFLGPAPDRLGLFLHTLWQHLLYGGLGATALSASRRQSRTQAVLSHAIVAARQTEARIQAVAARELRGQIQPERLTGLIEELRVRYGRDLEEGDRLLERLTDFLRAAMPSVRTGTATLAQEMETLEAYGRLVAEVAPGPAAWTFDRPAASPDMPFPALVLLPAAEALANAGDGRLDVRLRLEGQGVELRMTARGGGLPAELSERLRGSLRAVFGDRAAMSVEGPRLWLMLRQATPA